MKKNLSERLAKQLLTKEETEQVVGGVVPNTGSGHGFLAFMRSDDGGRTGSGSGPRSADGGSRLIF